VAVEAVAHRPAPRAALVPRTGVVADAIWIVAGVALISLAAQVAIHLPITPVPITGQTFAVLLVGAGLGLGRGAAASALYVLLPLAGLPLYADGAHGWHVISGATGGYLVAFPIAAALVGWLAERGWDRSVGSAIGAMLTGNVVIYCIGVPWLAISLGTSVSKALEFGLYPFVAGDLIKVYAASLGLPLAWRLVRRGRRDDDRA
jgi:biotin transport system substrate-specific component